MENILADLRQALKDNVDEKTLASSRNYFKEKVKPYGVRTIIVSRIAKELYNELKDKKTKDDIFALCEELWKSSYLEEGFIAGKLAEYVYRDYQPSDFKTFDRWVNEYVDNWASCDTLCNHAVAAFIEMYPEYISELKRWAKSDNRWVKRSAAVTLILPARKGMFLKDIFEIADILLLDNDDMVQKGYGWMLKAASEAHRKEVFDYVMSKKAVMPRTSLRYAIEKMPQDMRKEAMAK